MKRIYISGPLTSGNVAQNIHNAFAAGIQLLDAGYAPYIPHATYALEISYPRTYEAWMQLDFAWLKVCDAMVRLPGFSKGADREEQVALDNRIPIYYSVAQFMEADRALHHSRAPYNA